MLAPSRGFRGILAPSRRSGGMLAPSRGYRGMLAPSKGAGDMFVLSRGSGDILAPCLHLKCSGPSTTILFPHEMSRLNNSFSTLVRDTVLHWTLYLGADAKCL